jgi:hypothetical protein
MASTLSTIQPPVDLILKNLAVLPALALDTTSPISQFVQKLLSNQGFFVAALTSEGMPQVVVMKFSIYEQLHALVDLLPSMFGMIQLHKTVAASMADLLLRNVIVMGIGTVLTIISVYKTAQIITRDNQDNKAYPWIALAVVSTRVIYHSIEMTYEIARGLQAMA